MKKSRRPESFQSTPSARRATSWFGVVGLKVSISIHALREEGDPSKRLFTSVLIISIHALREEGDRLSAILLSPFAISIHALREEGDVIL